MDIDVSSPGHDRDHEVALVRCAQAAVAWYDPKSTGKERIDSFRLAWAWVDRANANDGKQPPRTHDEFMSLLERPVEEWLGVRGIHGSLMEAGAATELALDIVDETGDVNIRAEIVQALIIKTRQTFANRDNGDEEYRQLRRFVIEHATATVDQARAGLQAAGLAQQDLFEEIPPSYKGFTDSKEVFYPCPRCDWPMRFVNGTVQCESKICRLKGARFEKKRRGLSALAEREPPEPVAVAGRVRLQHAVWRYTLQPGLVELALEADLSGLSGVEVMLWPALDRFDLHVQAGQKSWDVDVKDWSLAWKLAKSLRDQHTTKGLCIVVPDWRSYQIDILRDRCGDLGLHFFTGQKFVKQVKSATNQKRGRRAKMR